MATEAQGPLPTFHSWVGGREVEGRGGRRPAVEPGHRRGLRRRRPCSTRSRPGRRVAAAQAAFPAWSRTSFRERARLLDRLREAIVDEADEVAAADRARAGQARRRSAGREVLPVARRAQAPLGARRGPAARRRARAPGSCCSPTRRRGSCTRRSGSSSRSSPGTTRGRSRSRCVASALVAGQHRGAEARAGDDARRPAAGRARAPRPGFPDGVVNVVAVDDARGRRRSSRTRGSARSSSPAASPPGRR